MLMANENIQGERMNTVTHVPTGNVLFEFHHATFFNKGMLRFFDDDGVILGVHDLQTNDIHYGKELKLSVQSSDVIIKLKEDE